MTPWAANGISRTMTWQDAHFLDLTRQYRTTENVWKSLWERVTGIFRARPVTLLNNEIYGKDFTRLNFTGFKLTLNNRSVVQTVAKIGILSSQPIHSLDGKYFWERLTLQNLIIHKAMYMHPVSFTKTELCLYSLYVHRSASWLVWVRMTCTCMKFLRLTNRSEVCICYYTETFFTSVYSALHCTLFNEMRTHSHVHGHTSLSVRLNLTAVVRYSDGNKENDVPKLSIFRFKVDVD